MKRRLGLIAIVLFSLAAGGAGFWMAVRMNAGPAPVAADAATPPALQMLQLDSLYVNLTGFAPDGSDIEKLMRIKLAVLYDPAHIPVADESAGQGVKDLERRRLIAADAPRVADLFVTYLRQLHERDLAGSLGMETLKTELLRRARIAAGNDGPADILIGELILQ